MKRRIASITTALALCLSLCPAWALAVGLEPDTGLCPHHQVHTEECGYVPATPGQDCTHEHDGDCFITETLCVHLHTEGCYPELDPDSDFDSEPEPSLCTHECSGDSGCDTLTLNCPHIHGESCGYIPEDAGAPCAFVCRICAIEDLIGKLPRSVTPDNKNQVEGRLNEILALYTELSADEQDQLNLSLCFDLQAQLDAADTPALIADATDPTEPLAYELIKDQEVGTWYTVKNSKVFNTGEWSFTATKSNAIIVTDTGRLYLKGTGKIISQKGAGVEVQTSGSLIVEDPDLVVSGTTYGLDIASGATAELSGGTFTGGTAAIRTADNNFNALLKTGYAFFDASGNLIPSENMAAAKTVVVKAQPVITWDRDTSEPIKKDYTGSPVETSDLPAVIIDAPEDLSQHLEYSYKKDTDSTYTNGLPKNAGTYEIVARLPELRPNYHAASSEPITLIINKLPAIANAPKGQTLTYNCEPQELVAGGVLKEGAAAEGAVIEFARSASGPYSRDIPTGITVSSYNVWYKVGETTNYTGQSGQLSARINHKKITPTVALSYYTTVFDGGEKQPTVTVKDGETVVPSSEYEATYTNNTNVGTATVTVKNKSNGNYDITTVTATFKITPLTQNALSITDKPEVVCYGDTITTLDTTGGTGDGKVTWSITAGNSCANINGETGELNITDVGDVTVKAVRAVDNYKSVEDTWSFKVQPKPVTAEVTVASKVYDGVKTIADIPARVNSNDLVNSNDEITIRGLTGIYDDVNAGTNKTVTLNSYEAIVDGAAAGKYKVSYPTTVTANIDPKTVTPTVTLSGNDLQTDNTTVPPKYSYNYDGTEKRPAVTVEDGGTIIPDSNYTVSYSNHKNKGSATVTITARADGNYTFDNGPVTVNFEIKNAKAVLTGSPQAKDLTYNGQLQDLVDVGTATGGKVIYSLTESGAYTEMSPQKKDAGTYMVYYKVEGDDNHEGTAPAYVYVTIKPKEITPAITLGTYNATYDGNAKEPTVTVKDGDVVIGTKDAANDAKEFTVSYSNNKDAGRATVTVSNKNGGNYIVNGTKTFEITKADPSFAAPDGKTDLRYNGTAQELITRGSSTDGKMVYSLDNTNFSEAVPTGTARGAYTVYYKVLGDANHNDLTPNPNSVTVNIDKNTVTTPTIELSSDTFRYNGGQQKPTVTVRDDNRRVIPDSEYEVTITGTNGNNSMVTVDTYTVTITTLAASNYVINQNNIREFNIVKEDQEVLSITNKPSWVYYGDTIQLGTTGGTGNGTVTWSITSDTVTTDGWITSGGLLTVKDVGSAIKVTATRTSSDNYNKISTTWEFSAGKKPVTAVLTGVDKDYDRNDSATVKAEVDPSDLVFGDTIRITDLSGTFENENVGTNKTITITTSTPTVNGTNPEKYAVTYPTTATASIRPVAATPTAPTPITPLAYKAGEAQALVNEGSATGGIMLYSLNGTDFSRNIPTATDAGTYTVYYKAQGDSNHTDSVVSSVPAEIKRQSVTAPQIELVPFSAQYDGSVKGTEVIVRDSTEHIIPDSEYKAIYETGTDWKTVGSHTVKIEDIAGGNYVITPTRQTFTITAAEQNPLEIVNKPGLVHFGDAPFTLSAVGGSGNGAITWSSGNESVATVDANGLVTIKGAGTVTITAKKEASSNYAESIAATYQFTVAQKPSAVTVTLTLPEDGYVYDDTAKTPGVTVTVDGGSVLSSSDYTVDYSDNVNAGTATVTVTASGNYAFETVRKNFTINPKNATAEVSSDSFTYNGSSQKPAVTVKDGEIPLVIDTDYVVNWGDTDWTSAGTHTVTVTAKDGGNYAFETVTKTSIINPKQATVTVRMPEGSVNDAEGKQYYQQDGNEKKPTVTVNDGETEIGSEQYTITWGEGDWKSAGTYTVTVDSTGKNYTFDRVTVHVEIREAPFEGGESGGSDDNKGGGETGIDSPTNNTSSTSAVSTPGTPSVPMQTSVRNGTATTVLNAAAGDKLVKEAVGSQSKSVVIKPEITGGVTKAEVSIPASTVSQLHTETDADLTVSTPIAAVTIPNAALDTLSSEGGTVGVVTEQVENAVTLTLTADGETIENVPGGVTLTVPVEDAVPGTVAVLVHDDGTRETIRKAVPENGELSVPLDGSATVEIVDNSKEFTDVSDTDWAADAVAFASAHELFNGTSETTFSPDEPMSRAMLATVLYNLEGRPAQSMAGEFSDVSSDAWYAESVSWATENGITDGYGDGQFGPDDSITREQLAVMLWKYAGSPAADDQTLNFTDADQASSYAMEALRWATANGILNGYGNGQLDPGGLATRAQAAQMLKNFMENT